MGFNVAFPFSHSLIPWSEITKWKVPEKELETTVPVSRQVVTPRSMWRAGVAGEGIHS